mmetsp:Transcript_45256/g.107288  ORF Transcript_45256/g.107288 Transcript_45256/m.107288 type:complete len:249 (+) Transcript_45256:598-1344(+)
MPASPCPMMRLLLSSARDVPVTTIPRPSPSRIMLPSACGRASSSTARFARELPSMVFPISFELACPRISTPPPGEREIVFSTSDVRDPPIRSTLAPTLAEKKFLQYTPPASFCTSSPTCSPSRTWLPKHRGNARWLTEIPASWFFSITLFWNVDFTSSCIQMPYPSLLRMALSWNRASAFPFRPMPAHLFSEMLLPMKTPPACPTRTTPLPAPPMMLFPQSRGVARSRTPTPAMVVSLTSLEKNEPRA